MGKMRVAVDAGGTFGGNPSPARRRSPSSPRSLYSNVLRVLVPILADLGDIEEGLTILEESLLEAASAAD